MNKIEHIGIAVSNLEASCSLYEKLLNTAVYKIEEVPTESVKTAFLQSGPNKIELLEATSDDSPVAKFIAKKGEGVHHVAFEVDDIKAEMVRLKTAGFVLLNDEPKRGADRKLVCFLHPKGTNGVLIELCQSYAFPGKARIRELSKAEQLNLFQFRNKLIIPDDLLAFFMLNDSEIETYSQDLFVFYKFDEFKYVEEEDGDFVGVPDFRKIKNTLAQHQDCFVFADYSITLAIFAIRLYKEKSHINEVYSIMGDQYRLVAKSFTEFVDIAREHISDVLF
jgi:methylmalonyl-CoA/ethylmalonyl-CoA epimerase